MVFRNTYEDPQRAQAYNELELGGTYLLVFNRLPYLLAEHVSGRNALDFGCGTGRSTRFLQRLGYSTVGLDISSDMVSIARERDPDGDYRIIANGDFSSVLPGTCDLVLSAFTFDNIPTREKKLSLFAGLMTLLKPDGKLVNIVSTPEMYTNEWVTFSTNDYPENRNARCGDVVRIVTRDYSDQRPVEDILWTDNDYRSVFAEAGLEAIQVEAPLADGDEGIEWACETTIPPWRIYVLGRATKQ